MNFCYFFHSALCFQIYPHCCVDFRHLHSTSLSAFIPFDLYPSQLIYTRATSRSPLSRKILQLTSSFVILGDLCENDFWDVCPGVRFQSHRIYTYLISDLLPKWKQYIRVLISCIPTNNWHEPSFKGWSL